MLRTPSFTLTTGKLFYLVRGSGKAFAAVNAHVMIAGLLHARVSSSPTAGDGFSVANARPHALSRTQRVHVEFRRPPRRLCRALVVQANEKPAPLQPANPLLLHLVEENKNASLKNWPRPFRNLARSRRSASAHDRILHTPDAGPQAFLATGWYSTKTCSSWKKTGRNSARGRSLLSVSSDIY